MIESVFEAILEEVVQSIPGALGAVFIDWEGESIDGYSRCGDTNLRLIGAHWGITYYQTFTVLKKYGLDAPASMSLRFAEQQVIIKRVTNEYLVLMALKKEANLGLALHRLQHVEDKIREHL